MPSPGRTANVIKSLCPLRPALALVLGSGFQGVLELVRITKSIPYHKLPGFPRTGVPGHAGQLVLGHIGEVPVLVLAGRAHYYEGHSLATVTFPIRVLAELGIQHLILTNAAGGINRQLRPGNLMLVRDHLNFMGEHPLRGPEVEGRTRFVDLSQAYDPQLSRWLKQAARQCRLPLPSGVYVAVSGPSYETPAEIKAFARLGADAVGMSTVPEVIVARQCGLAVAAVSCITNLAAGRSSKPLSHMEVLQQGQNAAKITAGLFEQFMRVYGREE